MKQIISLCRLYLGDPLIHQHGGIFFRPQELTTFVERCRYPDPLLEGFLDRPGTFSRSLRGPD